MEQEQKQRVKGLLSEFPGTSDAAWLAAAEKLLKGKPFDKVLRTSTYEGLILDPQYRKDVWDKVSYLEELPGEGSNVRGTKAEGYQVESWKVSQEIRCTLAADFNAALLPSLQRGQDAINLVIDAAGIAGNDPDEAKAADIGRGGTSISCLADMETAFAGVQLDCVDINIQAYNTSLEYAMLLAAYCEKQGIDVSKLQGCVGADPLGQLAETGSITGTLGEAYGKMAGLTLWAKETQAQLKTIDIHTLAYHNAGGSAVEELAFALATGVEYIRRLSEFGLEIDDIAPRIQFSMALGGNLFMEIAKLRAARILWHKVIKEFGGSDESAKMYIHGRTGKYNKTKYDPYVNMLRTTTEGFAGMIGGVDSLHIGSFDEVIREPDEFSRRIARNQQIILNEESHLGYVIDPAGGSWYIEELTQELAERAWSSFQMLESEGTFSDLLLSGKVQEIIEKVAALRQDNLAKRKDVLVGINMYANMLETPLEAKAIDYPGISCRRSNEIRSNRNSDLEIEPCAHSIKAAFLQGASIGVITKGLGLSENTEMQQLSQERLAEPFEKLRENMAAHIAKTGRAVRVFLANSGSLSQYKARADFSRGFMEVGGFEIIDQGGFDNSAAAAEAAIASKAEIVVICSTDDRYPEIVPAICSLIKAAAPGTMLILAGFPKDMIITYTAMGINEFIHLRANAWEVLSKAQKMAGVK
ncbi:MAG: acyl-CoA mutase large subunit family protein [Candidatus Cloacimonetes bacterium]|nr:acyl-CoA mutase large subunit family protein [Candidatus Cloacimonadota bacterium]